MFTTASMAVVLMAELALSGPDKISHRIRWNGLEIVEKMAQNNEKVIFLVPHAWGVDIPAMLMAASGRKMAAMFHNQRNPVVDYVWNSVRRRFGGKLHARNDGIASFVRSVRQGYWGYYLPDQDHGPEFSEFADFFATYKATDKAHKHNIELKEMELKLYEKATALSIVEELKCLQYAFGEEFNYYFSDISEKTYIEYPITITQDYTTIYTGNANKIGNIKNYILRNDIIKIYTLLKKFIENILNFFKKGIDIV